ncbi:hypothetical protein [Micromonospora aurantiaca (nom. illeg.)]
MPPHGVALVAAPPGRIAHQRVQTVEQGAEIIVRMETGAVSGLMDTAKQFGGVVGLVALVVIAGQGHDAASVAAQRSGIAQPCTPP